MLGRKPKKPEEPNGRMRPQLERTPAKVFSYYGNREQAEPIKRQRSRGNALANALTGQLQPNVNRSQKLLFLSILVLLACMAGYNSLLNPTPKVEVIGKAEDRLLLQDSAVYQREAKQLLQQSVLNSTKLTINTGKVNNALNHKFPELASAELSLPLFGHTPTLQLKPAKNIAIFVSHDNHKYVLDTAGRIVSSDTAAAAHGLPIITDQSGLPASIGKQVMSTDDVTFISRLLFQLNAQHESAVSFTLPPAGRELDVHLNGRPYFVKFSLEGDVLQQAGTYAAVKAQLASNKATPAQYIDVRVGERAYYK